MSKSLDSGGKKEAAGQKTCFVIMPISDHPDYRPSHFRMVYEDIIKPAVTECNYKPVRADDVSAANLIHLDILRQLLNADMAICDLSSLNPNVMFELGIRQAFDKPVVPIKDVVTRGPFDTNIIRYVEYDGTLTYRGVQKAQKDLATAITETADGNKAGDVNSIVRLLGLEAAALKPSQDSQQDARFKLLERSLLGLSGQVAEVNRVLTAVELGRSLFLPPSPKAHVGGLVGVDLAEINRELLNTASADSVRETKLDLAANPITHAFLDAAKSTSQGPKDS